MIVVTGASGFIGSNLVADLNLAGHTDLLLVDELGNQGKWKNLAKRRFDDIVHFDRQDALIAGLGQVRAVIHMGADSSTTASDGDAILRTNLHSSMAWWNWCTRTRTPFIYASSAATYGDGLRGFDDAQDAASLDALAPLNLYGWSKHAFDKWCTQRALRGDCPPQWAGLKFFNVYGPNEYHKDTMRSLVAKNTSVVAAGQPVTLFKSHRPDYADGAQLRDFVYVKDCCNVMMWLLGHPATSGIFNLGTGQARSFVELVQGIGQATGKTADIRFVDMPESIRPNYQYFTQARMDKLRQAGCDLPFHTLEQGITDYVQNYLLKDDPYR